MLDVSASSALAGSNFVTSPILCLRILQKSRTQTAKPTSNADAQGSQISALLPALNLSYCGAMSSLHNPRCCPTDFPNLANPFPDPTLL